MEKTLSPEERIRRAEEIYNRRRYNNRTYVDRFTLQEEKYSKSSIKAKITKKLIIQILACTVIYIILYVILNSNYFFSEEVHNNINNFLEYDIQFSTLYNAICSYWNSDSNIINKIVKNNGAIANELDNNISNNNESDNSVNSNDETDTNNYVDTSSAEAVGGAEETEVTEDKTQAEIDAEYIKQNYSFIWPLKGTITSKYGTREATDIVTANHYGIDIAGNTGDTIVAAMDGTVTLSSTEGDYGQHLQITNGEVSTLYAHCSKLCVSEGETIKQGEKIAEVGQTGRATGPHLHFEIKRDDRTLDPETVLS